MSKLREGEGNNEVATLMSSERMQLLVWGRKSLEWRLWVYAMKKKMRRRRLKKKEKGKEGKDDAWSRSALFY